MLLSSLGQKITHIISIYILVDMAPTYCRGLRKHSFHYTFVKFNHFFINVFLKIRQKELFCDMHQDTTVYFQLKIGHHNIGGSGMELEHLSNCPFYLVFFCVLFFFQYFFCSDFTLSILHGEQSSLRESNFHL